MRNLFRLLLCLIYPFILFFSFYLVYRKYKNTIKKYFKPILINSLIASVVIICCLLIFFHFEDTIYAYDYAGHWIRSLTLKKLFYEDPYNILSTVYSSMNNSDYSYLPALFNLPFILINESYAFFSISTFILFLLPTFIVLQIIYFNFYKTNKVLPLIIFLLVYPLYLTLFYGKVDCSGLLFISIAYSLIILPKFEDIRTLDFLSINLFAFLAIFLRRWYLYSIVCLYLSLLIKWLFYKPKNIKDIIKLLSSGIILLIISLLFFNDFITRVLTNNFEEAYAFYNRPGKLLSFVNNISPIICLFSLYGGYVLFKRNKELLIINLVSIVLPCAMIWKLQSFEYHHYYIFILNILILFTVGINNASKLHIPTFALLLVQVMLIFTPLSNTMPLFTNIRKNPEILETKDDLISLSEYLKSIEPDDETTAFIAAGSYGIISDDLLRNALLPNLDGPNIDSAVFDIRDGFPRDYQFIKYIIVVDPILYTDENYQHMFDVITNAITNNVLISSIYSPIYSSKIYDNNYTVTVYERNGEYTDEMKCYLYNEMLKYYPDKADFFSYILD